MRYGNVTLFIPFSKIGDGSHEQSGNQLAKSDEDEPVYPRIYDTLDHGVHGGERDIDSQHCKNWLPLLAPTHQHL